MTTVTPNTDFPRRGADYHSDYVIPLYLGDTRPLPRSKAKGAAASS